MRGRAKALTVLLGASLIGTTTNARAACFTPADNHRLQFQVIQQAPPPQGDRPYNYYPLTGAATMQLGTLASASAGYQRFYFQWGNRSNATLFSPAGRVIARKPNIQPAIGKARQQRTPFTSLDRANGCTLAQTAAILGQPKKAEAIAQAAGITLASELHQIDSEPIGPADTCVLAAGTLPADATGILLDNEPQDGRTPAQTLAFLKAFTDLVHGAGKKAMLLTDPLNAPSQRFGGITPANANAILNLFDLTTLMLWTRNAEHDIAASYRAQMQLLRHGGAVDPRRVIIDFDLSNTSLADAAFVHRTIVGDGLAGVIFWRNGTPQGGDCGDPVNGRIATVLFGSAGNPSKQD